MSELCTSLMIKIITISLTRKKLLYLHMSKYFFNCSQVEEAVLSSGVNKKLVLILNKIGEFLPRFKLTSHKPVTAELIWVLVYGWFLFHYIVPSVFPHNSLQLCSTNFSCGLRGDHGEYTVMQKNMLSPKFIGLTIKPPHFPPSPSLNTFNWSQKPTNQNKKKSVENVKWSCTLGLHSWVLTSYNCYLIYTPCAKSLSTIFKE